MAGGVTVGFMPVLGTGTITHGGSGQVGAASESPLGLFDALLQMAAGETLAGSRFVPAHKADDQQATLATLEEAAAQPELTVSEPMAEGDIDATPDLFADLLETLAALDLAVTSGMPIDPALDHKAAEALDALAAALGVPTSRALTIDPAIAEIAGGEIVAPDALATIEAAAAAISIPATIDDPSLPAATATANTAGVAAAATPDGIEPLATGVAPAADASADSTAEPATELPPLVKELADKLLRLATAVEPRAPALAQKLTALAEKLGSTDIDTATLAKLGLEIDPELPDGEIEAAIARLLAPPADPKPAPAPAPFTAATLAIPDPITMAPKARPAAPEPARTAEPAAAPNRTAPEAEIEQRAKPEVRSTERTERPADPAPQRSSFTPAPHSAAADNAGPPAQPANATALPPTAALAAETKAMHAAYSAPVRQINIPQVAFEIVRQVSAGASRFQIRLDPPELGRIDVKLDLDAAGNVNARMTVERAETLDLMQRDQRSLERALAQAGLDSNKTNLEFSLRQNPFAHQEQGRGDGNGRSPYAPFGGAAEADEAVPAPHVIAYRGSATAGGVNLFV